MGVETMAGGDTESSTDSTSSLRNVKDWVSWLRDKEMPIFSRTAQRIYESIDQRSVRALELSNIILEDPCLTAKLLKLANSSYYNPSNQKLSTVTRALVILGSELVRELTLTCSVIESVVKLDNQDNVNREVGHAIHSAVQAKFIATMVGDESPEEVFIAAFLNKIGHIAFWCYASDRGHQLQQLIDEQNIPAEKAEKQILGFSLSRLSAALSRSWKLGGLVEQTFNNPDQHTDRTQLVLLARQVAECSDKGWESPEMVRCAERIAKVIPKECDNLIECLENNAKMAIKIAAQFGARDAARFIACSLDNPKQKNESPVLSENVEEINNTPVQLRILHDLASMMLGAIDINILFEMISEGIHRGIGMERTFFGLLTPDRKALKEKTSVGWSSTQHYPGLLVPLKASNLFGFVLKQHEGLWIRPKQDHQLQKLFTDEVRELVGCHACFAMTVEMNQRPIGLFYADSGLTDSPLNQDAFDSFKHFVQQANIGLLLSQTPQPSKNRKD